MKTFIDGSNKIIDVDTFEETFLSTAPKRWMLVRDSSFGFLPDCVKDVYNNHKENCILFDEFTPNPTFESVINGLDLFVKTDCSLIVAIGGGSTIDVAKCIKLFSGVDNALEYVKNNCAVNCDKINGIPLIALPTTAGTGSESTKHAVIYYNGVKQSISHQSIIPNYVILEPSVLKSLPLYQKKCTMLDALCQAIESWWSVNSTEESREYSKTAVNLIIGNYKDYIFNFNADAAKQIMLAANYAGRAINITQTTAAHAMSYKITSTYKFPHGHAVAVCLSVVWEYMISHTFDCIDTRGQAYLENVFSEIPVDVNWFKSLMIELEMSNPVSVNRQSEIETLTQSVNPIRLKNNPVFLSKETLKNMYERIVK